MNKQFTGASIPPLYYEMTRGTGDDVSLIALICRWLDTQEPDRLSDLAAFLAVETLESRT